jgi:hypothetical protein
MIWIHLLVIDTNWHDAGPLLVNHRIGITPSLFTLS